jgi:REP element-mobilizing transposase RayT
VTTDRSTQHRRRVKKPVQLALPRTGGWGGKRRGAGRKPTVSTTVTRSRVPHTKRPVHKGRHPIHVTLRVKTGLPTFRQQRVHTLFAEVLRDQRRRAYKDDFRVVHFSIQSNHLHLIIEADSERAAEKGYTAVRSGISGLKIAFAKRLNMMLHRKGNVWDDRYHRHDLKTPLETVRGVGYLFNNYAHHGEWSYGDGVLDPFSTAWLYDGWDESKPHFIFHESEHWKFPVSRAETWLLREGWKKHDRLVIVPHHP